MKLRLTLIKAALLFINKKGVQKISYEPLRNYLSDLLVPLKDVIDKLTDKNPDNKSQLEKLWKEIQLTIKDNSIETAMQIIEKEVKDETTKTILLEILKDYLNETIPAAA